jgi:hypothetical protein
MGKFRAPDRRAIRRNCRAELGIALHTAYRKAVDSRHSGAMWNLINILDYSLYRHFLETVDAFLPLDKSKTFGWERLRGAALTWDADRMRDDLPDLMRAKPHLLYEAKLLRYLIETQPDEDWKAITYWLGGR